MGNRTLKYRTIGDKIFDFEGTHPYIMGILNVTPDSFSDGGNYEDVSNALFKAEEMIKDGAEIIDVGGESTRPGYTMISPEEEIMRVVPVITAIKKNFDITISLDTYKYEVAEAGIECGADMINDIWGLKADRRIGDICAREDKGIIIMHNRDNMNYNNFMDDVIADLNDSLDIARSCAIRDEYIIIDPGVGFAKVREHNLSVMHNIKRLKEELGYPVMLAVSRKSVIGLTLNLPVHEREEGTIAANVLAYNEGCRLFRVHDVKMNRRALDMAEAICTAS